jgi:hypothetical protein
MANLAGRRTGISAPVPGLQRPRHKTRVGSAGARIVFVHAPQPAIVEPCSAAKSPLSNTRNARLAGSPPANRLKWMFWLRPRIWLSVASHVTPMRSEPLLGESRSSTQNRFSDWIKYLSTVPMDMK